MKSTILNRVFHKIAMVSPGGSTVRPFLHKLRGVKIGEKVWISQYVYLDEIHPEAITIGDHSSIGLRTSVIAHLYWGPRKMAEYAGSVHIGSNVFVGPHCVILPHVTIGDGAVIAAGTVVSQNVPANAVWGDAKAGPIATATVPLTHNTSYELFAQGLRPFRVSKPASEKQDAHRNQHPAGDQLPVG